jgi:hypothetical protein
MTDDDDLVFNVFLFDCRRKILIGVAAVMLILAFLGLGEILLGFNKKHSMIFFQKRKM